MRIDIHHMARALLAAFAFLVLATSGARAEDLRFKVVTAEVALGDVLRLEVSPPLSIDPAKVKVRLNGMPLPGAPDVIVYRDRVQLGFALDLSKDSREIWQTLLGYPFRHGLLPQDARESLAVGLEIDGQVVEPVPQGGRTTLLLFGEQVYFASVLVVFVVLGTVFGCVKGTMIRDQSGPVPVHRTLLCFSLGRFQMAVWMCLIVASFLFILVICYDMDSISAQSLVLLGISGATALGSIALDKSRNGDAAPQLPPRLTELGLTNLAAVDALYETVHGKDKNPTEPSPVPGFAGSEGERWNAYLEAIAPYSSRGFFKDILNDANGPALHRWQIFIWTLVLGFVYGIETYAKLQTPVFSADLLALMGIGGGFYLGFKVPEKQA